MTYRSNYVPKKRKVNYKLVVLFSIIALCIAGLFIYKFLQGPEDAINDYAICGLSSEESFAKFEGIEEKETVSMADHDFYGQSLAVFKDPYSIHNKDGFNGRTIFLNNVCTGKEQVFLLGLTLDEKIPLQQLEPGFYEIQVMDGFNRAQLVSEDTIDDANTTATRNGKAKNVRIVSNASLFKKEETQVLDKNYVFLEVTEKESSNEVVDVVLDPNGLYEEIWGGISYGAQVNEFVESDEMYRLAEAVRTELVRRGYRVKVIRGNEDAMNTHGSGGRIETAYGLNAKYYVHFKMYESNIPYDVGAYTLHSNNSSHRFSNAIMKEIIANTKLEIYTDDETVPGVVITDQFEGMDNNDIIRETGGRMTQAGVYDVYGEINAFAKERNHGMESVLVVLGNISDDATYQTWQSEFDQIVLSIANGIAYELGSE